MYTSPNERTYDLTWRKLRQPLKTRIYRVYLRFCMDRLKLPCKRLEHMEVLREWAEIQTRRHLSGGSMVYPVQKREE